MQRRHTWHWSRSETAGSREVERQKPEKRAGFLAVVNLHVTASCMTAWVAPVDMGYFLVEHLVLTLAMLA